MIKINRPARGSHRFCFLLDVKNNGTMIFVVNSLESRSILLMFHFALSKILLYKAILMFKSQA